MKKLLFIFLLLTTTLATKAQYNAGWDSAINFGGKGVQMLDMKYVNNDLYFFAELSGKYKFAGTQYDSAEDGWAYAIDKVYGKITSTGQQVLIRRFTVGAQYGKYNTQLQNGRISEDGSLIAYKGGVSFNTTGELAVDYGNGVISQNTGIELLKINNAGVAQWIKPVNPGSNVRYSTAGVTDQTLHAMQVIGGNIYLMVAANNLNPAGTDKPTRIIKFNSSGDEAWHFEITKGGTFSDAMPRQFVDNEGNLTFYFPTPDNALFNGESLPLEAPYNNSYKTWLVNLDANGQKKWSHSTYMGTSFLGVNPQNGEIYFNYVYQKSPKAPAVLAPFSNLPNLSPNSYVSVYNWRGLIAFDKQGNILRTKVNWPINNFLNKLAISDEGRMLMYGKTGTGQVLRAGGNFTYESGVYQAAMELDANFEPISVFKFPEIKAIAISGNKFALGANFKTALTFNSITLNPTDVDGDATKDDILIAQGNLDNIPLTPEVTIWTGNTSTDWNTTSNWTNGIPTTTMRAAFSGNPLNMPTNIPSSTKAGQVFITAGANITLPPTYNSLVVADRIFNDGKLIVENASFLFNFFGAGEVAGAGEFAFKGAASVFNFTGKIANTVSFDNTLEMSGATVNRLKFMGVDAKFKGDVTISNPAENAISGISSPSNTINGILTRAINATGNYSFPMAAGTGASEKSSVVTLSPTGLVGVNFVAAKYNNGTPTGTTPTVVAKGSSITSVLNGGLLTLTPDQQPTAGTYGLSFSLTGSTNTVANPLRYLIIKRDNNTSPWVFQGENNTAPISTGSGTTNMVTTSLDGITSFSDFAMGIGDQPITLPVRLMNFTAKASGNLALLNWQTASELNNDKFEIERSTNATDFVKIGEVKGNGTSQKISVYSFLDRAPANGANYYRLKQVDFNGKFELSDAKAVNFNLETAAFSIYPNPTTEVVNFSSEIMAVEIYNLRGTKVFQFSGNTNSLKIPKSLSSGVYIIKATLKGGAKVSKQLMVN